MRIKLLILLSVFGGIKAKEDYRNQTVECSLNQTAKCYATIHNLGGIFADRYADNATQLNKTCQKREVFNSCIMNVPLECNAQSPIVMPPVKSVVDFVKSICTNGTSEYNDFLNSSVCYNKYQKRRHNCENKLRTSKKDAWSLCCKSRKFQNCLKNDLKSVCPKNSTDFQDKLIDIYSNYTNILCEPYVKLGCGAASNFLSLACIFLSLKLFILNYF